MTPIRLFCLVMAVALGNRRDTSVSRMSEYR